jgi:hypothetical protein
MVAIVLFIAAKISGYNKLPLLGTVIPVSAAPAASIYLLASQLSIAVFKSETSWGRGFSGY